MFTHPQTVPNLYEFQTKNNILRIKLAKLLMGHINFHNMRERKKNGWKKVNVVKSGYPHSLNIVFCVQ